MRRDGETHERAYARAVRSREGSRLYSALVIAQDMAAKAGRRAPDRRDADAAHAELERIARDRVAKSGGGLTFAQAYRGACRDEPELAGRAVGETISA